MKLSTNISDYILEDDIIDGIIGTMKAMLELGEKGYFEKYHCEGAILTEEQAKILNAANVKHLTDGSILCIESGNWDCTEEWEELHQITDSIISKIQEHFEKHFKRKYPHFAIFYHDGINCVFCVEDVNLEQFIFLYER